MPTVLFITYGVRNELSSCCISPYAKNTNKIPHPPKLTNANNTAGIPQRNGHRYGIKLVTHAIIASDQILGNANPKRASICNTINTAIHTQRQTIVCPLNHKPSLAYILSNFAYTKS